MTAAGHQAQVDLVCFGMLCQGYLLVVEAAPVHNGGTKIREVREYFGDDATIVAMLLHRWGVSSGIVGTSVGDDDSGRKIAKWIEEAGIPAMVRFSEAIETEFEVCVSDPSGARTYFWQRSPKVLETLRTADLSMLRGARMLYVDWYDGDYILPPMRQARDQGAAVYLNLESRYQDAALLSRLAPLADICQVSMDEPEAGGGVDDVVDLVLAAGCETVAVTMGRDGCVVAGSKERLRLPAPAVKVVDATGAGAAFSAGFIYAHLQGWTLEACARLATATASLKCGMVGLTSVDLSDAQSLAAKLTVH
jgi:ribokinase